jgi:hypothetical protein
MSIDLCLYLEVMLSCMDVNIVSISCPSVGNKVQDQMHVFYSISEHTIHVLHTLHICIEKGDNYWWP